MTGRFSCLPSREVTFSPSMVMFEIRTSLMKRLRRTWATSTDMLMASPRALRTTWRAPPLNMVMQAVT